MHNLGTAHSRALSRMLEVQIVRLRATEAKTGIKKTKIYKLMRESKFPPCIRLGDGRAVGWLEEDLDRWIQQQIKISAAARK